MADRRNIWARLYDEAQDPDPMIALAAIKRINNIVRRWQNAAVGSAVLNGQARGERREDILRQISEVLDNERFAIKADGSRNLSPRE
jgi:hypothetical protein